MFPKCVLVLPRVQPLCQTQKLRLKQDRGQNPLGLKVCSRSTDEAENRNSDVVRTRANRRVEITSRFRHGGLRLLWFVLQSKSIYSPFFMARFGMRELCACFSRHFRLHSACLSVLRVYVGRHR